MGAITSIGIPPVAAANCTVTFAENASATDQVVAGQSASTPTPLTLVNALNPKFSDAGYTFSDWSTAADGPGVTYTDGEVYSFASDLVLYAQWAENHVTFFENASVSDTVSAVQLGTSSSSLTSFGVLSPTFVKPGFTFAGWNTRADGSGVAYADGSTYNFAAGSIQLFAQWSPSSYVVSYDANGGSVSPSSATYSTGSTPLTLPTPTEAGYAFVGWFSAATGGTLVGAAGGSYSPSSSLTLYAQWTPLVDTVTLAANGGSVNPATMSFATGSAPLILPTPTYPGYSFTGWFSAPTGGTLVGAAGSSFSPTSSLTLFAQWTADTYAVTFDANGGSVAVGSLTFTSGSSPLALPTPVRAGYASDGWFSAPSGGTLIGMGGASFSPSASVTLYAQWTPDTYTVTYVGDGATVTPSSTPYTTGSSPLTLPTSTNAGYTFDGWFSSPTGGTLIGAGGAPYTPTASTTLFAQWTPGTYVVDFVADGGTPATSSLSFTTGTTPMILPAPTLTGSDFIGWFSAPTGGTLVGTAGMALTPTAPTTLYAQWRAQPTFTITFVSNGVATNVSPLQGLVGSAVTIPASATLSLAGYTFAGWNTNADGSGVSYAAGQSVAPAASLTLYAQWRAVPTVVISFNLNGASGSMTPLSGPESSTLTLPGAKGVSRKGYRFAGWATSAAGAATLASGQSITLTESEVLYAQWRPVGARYLMSSVGPFSSHAATLTSSDESQVIQLASRVASGHYHRATIYGYVSSGSPSKYARAMSRDRAERVASALRAALRARGLGAVRVVALGEGPMAGHRGVSARRVEVFIS
ncbi:MAG TPA: InlB B-repeat-containing protein [Acidimicrobiales bacterium]|nr:InlB B-repeat-containing protein [Acidimicrobiales bacterium]